MKMSITTFRPYFFLLFVFLLPKTALFAQQNEQEAKDILRALNKQVDFMNEVDNALYPEFLNISDLNQQMLDYYNGNKAQTFNYQSKFSIGLDAYNKAVYQRMYLPNPFKDDLQGRLDSLKKIADYIARDGKGLEEYLKNKMYEKDNMYEGFQYLTRMGKNLRGYLVRHEALHSVLKTTWHSYYIKDGGNKLSPIVEQMRRILYSAHGVYLDLAFDPGTEDANKHLKEINRLLEELQTMAKSDPEATKSAAFGRFMTKLDENYFASFGPKSSPSFYKKLNSVWVKDLNAHLIPDFNEFVSGLSYKTVLASLEPPYINAIAPTYPEKPSEPVAVVTEKLKPLEPAPKVDPKVEPKPEPVVKVEPKPEPKPEPVIKVEPKVEPKPEPVVKVEPKPEPKPEPVVKVEPKVEPKPEPVVKVEPKVTPPAPEPPKPSALDGYAFNNLLFLIDVSGSMRGGGRLDTFKAAFKYILNEMRPEDKVSLVVYSGNARTILKPTSSKEKTKILAVINGLTSDGKSNLSEGLDVSYTEIKASKIAGGNNRIILVTDGYIPLHPELNKKIGLNTAPDLTLSVFLFGSESDQHIDIEGFKELSKLGKGNFTAVGRSGARTAMLKEARAVRK
jgi:uncharacterized protein YegL